ncbi:ATP-binding cassette domain-containing protein [Streptomyces sp. BE133]|uniref:ATP-binding cassette domain-containing protein n=1 Tax=Streptomyces sp. BE133 TaxID=3002523 RepID=UPI002E78EF20|nr:ATP-binding cassette domain-containing protein [Streptomyces sp. BE133]MEE1806155.1 hypothetical protein [Streptomyces sp. BE133]
MEQVGLREDPDTLIKGIGVGKQQLAEIAMEFAKDVKLLILDEPTAALDQDDSQHLLSLLDDIKTSMVAAKLPKIAKRGVIDPVREYRIAEDYHTSLRIRTPSVDEEVVKLSGGNQQKVVLAKWMFTEPDL